MAMHLHSPTGSPRSWDGRPASPCWPVLAPTMFGTHFTLQRTIIVIALNGFS